MTLAWSRLGLRGRLAFSIGAIVIAAFGIVFAAVRHEMADERGVISHEERREGALEPGQEDGGPRLSPVSDAQSEVEKTFLVAGGVALAAALLAGYLLAARAAAPLRRMATTAAAVDAGDLSPRIGDEGSASVEVRTLAETFDGMLDRLEQAFSRQRQFVSDASHELRTPLTAIRGQLEVLAREENPSGEEVRRVEGVVLAEMARVERLVTDLLTLARLDEGEPLERQRIPLAPFLERFAAETALGEIELGEIAAGSLSADPDRLTQVLRNLVANARRHAGPDGKVIVSARAERGLLTIAVDDDGPGIDPGERERVFDRFQRSEAARDRRSGGSGLGLAIARATVELHGGRIWIEDSPLGGARVAFALAGFEPEDSPSRA